MNRAIYPGSFDPFTNGHLDICMKASKLFDEVHIVIAVNTNKRRVYNSETIKNAIEKDLNSYGITNCFVHTYNGLVALLSKDLGAKYMIRGLRNNMDYNYEENIAEVNKLVNPDIEYIYLRADNKAISSSMVRELHNYGQDITKYVPQNIHTVINDYQS